VPPRPAAARRNAVGIGGVDAILAFQIAIELEHRQAVVALDEEVIIVCVSQLPQLVAGGFLRLLTAELSGFFFLIPAVDDGIGDLNQLLDLVLAIFEKTRFYLAEPEPDGDDQTHEQHRDEQQQAVGYR
jgi:hypothetical protein